MKISIPVLWNDWTKNEYGTTTYDMYLSGYFTEHINTLSGDIPVYLSYKFLETEGMSQYPLNILFQITNKGYSRADIESRIINDVSITEQQRITALDSNESIPWENTFGGYGMATACGGILLLSMFLLIYNLMIISITDALPRMKMMKDLGMTKKQVIQMLHLQNFQIIGRGCIIGIFLSYIVGCVLYPRIVERVFLKDYGSTLESVSLISLKRLFYIAFLVFVMAWVAGWLANARVHNNKTLLRIKRYRKKMLVKQGKEIFYLQYLAWHNVTRIRKRFLLTIATIAIGCTVAIGSVVISRGVDAQNQIEQNPDFCVSITESVTNEYQWEWDESERQQFQFVSHKMIRDIADIAEIREKDITMVEGGFGSFDHEEEALQPLVSANRGNIKTNTGVTIQSVDKTVLDILIKYADKYGKRIDSDLLESGAGVLILHNNMLSLEEEEEVPNLIGKSLEIMNMEGETAKELICSGYLDASEKGFPQIDMTWHPRYTNYFIISNETFQNLGYDKVTFSTSFDVDKENESRIKKALLQYLQKQNRGDAVKYFELTANSDTIQQQEDYLVISRTIMILVTSALLGIALINYANTLIASILIRREEFTMMRNIGMERKKIWKMLIYEGLFYSIVSTLVILSFGNALILLLAKIISLKLSYFVFIYPIKELSIIIIILTLLCIAFPVFLYNRTGYNVGVKNNFC